METVSAPVLAKGRIAFIGDASHGCATSLQQGAAQALEDSIVLSDFLDSGNILIALQKYTSARMKKISWVMEKSNNCMKIFNKKLTNLEKIDRNEKIKAEGLNSFILWQKLFNDDF